MFIFGLGGFMGPFIALGCWLRPISEDYTVFDKRNDIKDSLWIFICCFLMPFYSVYEWIREGTFLK